MGTNLILHHGVAYVLGQVAKLLCVRSVVQEPCDPASLLQLDEVRENTIQFPNNICMSDKLSNMKKGVTI